VLPIFVRFWDSWISVWQNSEAFAEGITVQGREQIFSDRPGGFVEGLSGVKLGIAGGFSKGQVGENCLVSPIVRPPVHQDCFVKDNPDLVATACGASAFHRQSCAELDGHLQDK